MTDASRVGALLAGLLLMAYGAGQPLACPPFGWLWLQLVYLVPPMLIWVGAGSLVLVERRPT